VTSKPFGWLTIDPGSMWYRLPLSA